MKDNDKQLQHYEPLPPAQSSIQIVLERWEAMNQVAEVFIKSPGFLPSHIKSKEQALAIMIKGAELDVPFTEALNHIYPVNGRTTCMGQLLLGLMERAGYEFKQHQITSEKAVVTGKGPRDSQWKTAEFTKQDAKEAELLNDKSKPCWQKYLKDMMFWRAVSRFANRHAAGVIGGLILAEAVGIPVTINEQGEQVLEGEVELDASGAEIPPMTQEQLEAFLKLLPGEEDQLLFRDFLFERGSIETNMMGEISLATLMEPVARDLLERWYVIQGELEDFIKRQKGEIDPETYAAFRQDLIDAGYKLLDRPAEGSEEAEVHAQKKQEVEALIKEHNLDAAKVKQWLNEKTERFGGKIGKNQFKKLSFAETSLDVLQDLLDFADTWVPYAKKAGLEKQKKGSKRKPPAS